MWRSQEEAAGTQSGLPCSTASVLTPGLSWTWALGLAFWGPTGAGMRHAGHCRSSALDAVLPSLTLALPPGQGLGGHIESQQN